MSTADPHALSLKVLRLSRPTLASQQTLPDTTFPEGLVIKKESSFAYASPNALPCPLTPLLTLPSSFGLAYVGETFACTLCINNELDQESVRTVGGLEVVATMQSPSNQAGTRLQLHHSEDRSVEQLSPGHTAQYLLRQDLKESGPHVLAVTVTYTESTSAGGEDAERTRTFRKLYQFVAQQLIAVRSKVSSMKPHNGASKWWMIEAQLENVGESSVTLEQVKVEAQAGLAAETLDAEPLRHVPITLKPQDIEQMMFSVKIKDESASSSVRRQLAQLGVYWRGTMGEPGQLSTGWLISKD